MLPPRLQSRRRSPDDGIRQTDGDASQARLSAVRKSYLRDPFISFLVPQPHLVPTRPPLINIGTYTRSEAIDELIVHWINSVTTGGSKVQMISIGAGSDTRFWRLATGSLGHNLGRHLARYLELDFAENTTAKIQAIRAHQELHSVLGETSISGSFLTSDVYAIRDVDLRQFRDTFQGLFFDPVDESGSSRGLLDTTLPTLILSECVLCYMNQEQSDGLLQWFGDTFVRPAVIIYEMYGLHDSFGRVMKENLRSRNVVLPGVDAYPELDDQCQRLVLSGFTSAHALSLKVIRNQYIDAKELSRITKLEFLDELEELELVLDHYFISWGFKEATEFPLQNWGLKIKGPED